MSIGPILKNMNQLIEITDINNFSSKLQNFISSFKNKKNLAVLTDFDFTITKLYNYQKNKTLGSSYRFYDESLIGGDQQKIIKAQDDLCKLYINYERDTSIDIKIREEKMLEFYSKSLDIYINPKFTRDSIGKMLEKLKDKFEIRKYLKEYFELLIELEIPIIIISGGIKEVIVDLLKQSIKDFELYCIQKKIVIIANELIFDKEKGCIGYSPDVIYTFNKSLFVKNIIEKDFPQIENYLIFGDHLNDYDSVQDLNLSQEHIIGFGFINIKPEYIEDESKKKEITNNIEDFKKIYDVNLIGDTDFLFMLKIMEMFKKN
jgi:2-hydroxy-3-keto-5-methylthiopentenyl-1-phosphate phosphatase